MQRSEVHRWTQNISVTLEIPLCPPYSVPTLSLTPQSLLYQTDPTVRALLYPDAFTLQSISEVRPSCVFLQFFHFIAKEY